MTPRMLPWGTSPRCAAISAVLRWYFSIPDGGGQDRRHMHVDTPRVCIHTHMCVCVCHVSLYVNFKRGVLRCSGGGRVNHGRLDHQRSICHGQWSPRPRGEAWPIFRTAHISTLAQHQRKSPNPTGGGGVCGGFQYCASC